MTRASTNAETKGPGRVVALLAPLLLVLGGPADAWLLQAKIDPRQATRLDQTRQMVQSFEQTYRQRYRESRRRHASATACRHAREAALSQLPRSSAWQFELQTSATAAGSAESGTDVGQPGWRFRQQIPLSGLPAACARGAGGSAILVITR